MFLVLFAVADLKHDLQVLRDRLAEMSQRAEAPTLVPPPAVCVPTSVCSHTVNPVTAMSHEGSPTQAPQTTSAGSACAGEPTASPMVLPGQEPTPGPKAMQLGNNTPSAAGKAITAFADGLLSPGLTLLPPQAPLIHPQAILGAPKAREPTLTGSTPTAPTPALTANSSVSPAISLAPHSSSSTGSKRGFALSSSSPFGIMASTFGGGHSSSPAAEHAVPLVAAMSPGTASPAVALAAFGSPVTRRPSTTATATTGFDLEAAPGVLSAAASGPPAAAAPPHAPAPLATDTPAAVRGGDGLVMPVAVAPSQSLTPDDAPVSGEPVFEKEVPPTAVATTPVVTDTAGLAEAPAPFGSPVASPEPTTAVANSGVALGVITATTCASSGPATPGCSATTAAMPPAAVYGNDSAELAVPQTTMPEEPSASLHSLAPAGPQHSAMPVSNAGDAQARPSDFLLLEIQTCFRLSRARLVSGFHVQGWPGPLLCCTEAKTFGGRLSAGASTHAKASHSCPALRTITIMLGNGPQPGEGFVTPGYAKGMEQGDYKTPPSGEWMSYDSAGSSDRAYLVWLVSLGGVIALDVSCHHRSEHQPSCSMQSGQGWN